jgi:hypothetical protein
MGEEKLMFVSRRDDGSIYGAWTVRQFLGQEELADGAPELVVFMTPRPMPDLSEIDNLDKVLKALALLTRQYANRRENVKQVIVQETAKAAPPVMVTAWAWTHGLTLTDLVALATLAYIALQAGYLIWKWWREFNRRR